MHSTCVIYNPSAGRGRAQRMIAAARSRFGSDVDFRPTSGPWHAVELACQAAEEGFARVVAAGGDGTVHEVANGLLASSKPDVILSVIPIGSMNDFAYTSGMAGYWDHNADEKTDVTRVDVGQIMSETKQRYFINSVGIGFTGYVTLESRKIRRLRGLLLYSLALFRAVYFHFKRPLMSIELDGISRQGPTLLLSLFLGQREGGFPVVPEARTDDGQFESLLCGQIRWWEVLRYFPALLKGTLPRDHPELQLARCERASIQSSVPLCIHTDGELFAVPEDGLNSCQVTLLPRRLAVEIYPKYRYGGGSER